MTPGARHFEEQELHKKWLRLDLFCHEVESLSIRAMILREILGDLTLTQEKHR